jgi:hypothetical protein
MPTVFFPQRSAYNAGMTAHDLLGKIKSRPFRPFRVRLADNTVINMIQPDMTIVGLDSAVLPTEFTRSTLGNKVALRWKTIALKDVLELADLDNTKA